MPTPNDLLSHLASADYLYYRTLKAAQSGRRSAQMIAAINALESKLAVRGRIGFDTPSANIFATVKSVKKANATANKELANDNLDAFLKAKALPLKEELEFLAGYLLTKAPPGTKWIPGPLKTLEKALSKTEEDYDYAWTLNKDLIRGTLVTQTAKLLDFIPGLMVQTCTEKHGMFLIKNERQKSVLDGGTMKSGYSGLNFVIQFRDHTAFGVEVQANTVDMMYGKMSKKDFCEKLKVSETAYAALQKKHQFPGGLGHSLYDIQDIQRSKCTPEEGNVARELALWYNDACRGQYRKTTLNELNERIQKFARNLTTTKAKELWKHDVDGSGWKGYTFLSPYAHSVQGPSRVRLT